MKTIIIYDLICNVIFEEYYNGRTCITLIVADTGEEYTVATVNIPSVDLANDEVLIKNYSENEGVLEALIQGGIVKPTGRSVSSGFVEIPVVKLL